MNYALKRAPLTDQVEGGIIRLIEDRGLVAGDSLPATSELATLFEVSLPVVREAVASLAALGLLNRQQGRESIISTPDAAHLSRLLSFRIATSSLNDEEVQQFRETVEVGSARLAALNADGSAQLAIDAALESLFSVRTESELHEADVAFHAAVARASGNDLFTLTLDALTPLLRRLRTRVWSGWVHGGGDLQPILDAHVKIQAAIRDHDPEAAAQAMADHLGQARAGLDHAAFAGPTPANPGRRYPTFQRQNSPHSPPGAQ